MKFMLLLLLVLENTEINDFGFETAELFFNFHFLIKSTHKTCQALIIMSKKKGLQEICLLKERWAKNLLTSLGSAYVLCNVYKMALEMGSIFFPNAASIIWLFWFGKYCNKWDCYNKNWGTWFLSLRFHKVMIIFIVLLRIMYFKITNIVSFLKRCAYFQNKHWYQIKPIWYYVRVKSLYNKFERHFLPN